jgi:hypothetical protein
VVKADFLGEVQPHECEARNDKGPRRMPQPFLVLMDDFVRDSRGTACHRHHGWWCRVITVAIGRIGCPAWCNFARGAGKFLLSWTVHSVERSSTQ